VKAAIFNDPDLKSMEINVETFKGVVQLSGFVNSQGDSSWLRWRDPAAGRQSASDRGVTRL
jgi:hypothetical protein